MEWLRGPWPWYVVGPLIGLFVPALLLVGNKPFGISSTLRDVCAALAPRGIAFFEYDWVAKGRWNLLFLAGVTLGGFIAVTWLGVPDVAISDRTRDSLAALGLRDLSGLVPREIFAWPALATLRGFTSIVVGGFLVGFGSAYAGGCTSGHAISGLADLQLASVIAVLGFFAGGLVATHVLIPVVFGW